MRAYLMTSSAVSGANLRSRIAAGTVASGSAGAKLGAWGSFSVYPIDFTLTTAGHLHHFGEWTRFRDIADFSCGYSGESLHDAAGEQSLLL